MFPSKVIDSFNLSYAEFRNAWNFCGQNSKVVLWEIRRFWCFALDRRKDFKSKNNEARKHLWMLKIRQKPLFFIFTDYILEILNTSAITTIVDDMAILFRIHEVNKYVCSWRVLWEEERTKETCMLIIHTRQLKYIHVPLLFVPFSWHIVNSTAEYLGGKTKLENLFNILSVCAISNISLVEYLPSPFTQTLTVVSISTYNLLKCVKHY